MLLFKVGLLTLINIDSYIFLAKLCPSLPIIWKFLWLVGWPVRLLCWWMGEGSFRCFFYLSPKVLEVSPIYSSSQPGSPHWYQYMAPLWLTIGSLSWGDQEVLDGAATFKVVLNVISTTDLFDAYTKTLCVGYDNVTLSFDFIGDSLGNCGALVIKPINDLTGRLVESFLHLVQSPFKIFVFSESLPKVIHFLLEQLRSAAHCFGPMGEGVDDTEFGWEVCMHGFPYTVTDRLPSASGLTNVSRKGMDPSSLLSSTVNRMAGSTLLMCWRKFCLLASMWMTKVSSTNLCQNLGVT